MRAKQVYLSSSNHRQVDKLLKRSIPDVERMSWALFYLMISRGKAKYYSFYEDKELVGLIYYFDTKEYVYVLYLAVNPDIRSKGYGSKILEWINNHTKKKIVIDIESVKENSNNSEQRQKRLNFYLKNGFNLTNIIVEFRKNKFQLLTTSNDLTLEKYKQIVKEITSFYNPDIYEQN